MKFWLVMTLNDKTNFLRKKPNEYDIIYGFVRMTAETVSKFIP